ncbi:MAG: hypothetical protein H0V81_06910 [Solirubrobacterales bacterium]|nr:hypothetical protein [Solirubrobacterales bacterium]
MVRIAATVLSTAALLLAAGCGEDDGKAPATGSATAPTTSSPAAAPAASDPSGGAAAPSTGDSDDEKFPDVRKAELTPSGDAYTLAVTVSSPYDSPERYADGWRVLAAGTEDVLGEHMLAHDHASEQPFTREQTGLEIPDDVKQITVEGRDQQNGFGGDTVTIDVPQPG